MLVINVRVTIFRLSPTSWPKMSNWMKTKTSYFNSSFPISEVQLSFILNKYLMYIPATREAVLLQPTQLCKHENTTSKIIIQLDADSEFSVCVHRKCRGNPLLPAESGRGLRVELLRNRARSWRQTWF